MDLEKKSLPTLANTVLLNKHHKIKHVLGTLGWLLSLFGDGRVGPLRPVTRVHGLLGGSAVDVHVVIGPRGNVAKRREAAVGQGGDLCRVEQPVPQVELGKFSDQSLGGVKVASQRVLQSEERRSEAAGGR